MPRATPQAGRTRLAITIVLAVLIGVAGAVLLPVLIHETEPPAATSYRAEIGFAVPDAGLPQAGVFHVFATHPGGVRLSVEEGIPQGANQEAVIGMIADAIADSDWPEGALPSKAGSLLSFPSVTSIGGSPGVPGVPLSISVASRPGQALSVRIRQREGADSPEGRVRLAFSARGVVAADGVADSTAPASATTSWLPYGEVLQDLIRRLHQAGWVTATAADDGRLVLMLPDGGDLGSAILTVEYAGGVPQTHDWSFELLR